MAKSFGVSVTKYPLKEGSTDMTTAAASIVTDLNALSIGTSHEVYSISTVTFNGFLWVICIYEP